MTNIIEEELANGQTRLRKKTGIIWFNVKEAYEHLVQYRKVYTLREINKYPRKEGKHLLMSSLNGKPYYKGKVFVEFEAELIPSQVPLSEWYVQESGFPNLGQWVKALKNPDRPHYLYRVTLLIGSPKNLLVATT
jgi:hypothetical protein